MIYSGDFKGAKYTIDTKEETRFAQIVFDDNNTFIHSAVGQIFKSMVPKEEQDQLTVIVDGDFVKLGIVLGMDSNIGVLGDSLNADDEALITLKKYIEEHAVDDTSTKIIYKIVKGRTFEEYKNLVLSVFTEEELDKYKIICIYSDIDMNLKK